MFCSFYGTSWSVFWGFDKMKAICISGRASSSLISDIDLCIVTFKVKSNAHASDRENDGQLLSVLY